MKFVDNTKMNNLFGAATPLAQIQIFFCDSTGNQLQGNLAEVAPILTFDKSSKSAELISTKIPIPSIAVNFGFRGYALTTDSPYSQALQYNQLFSSGSSYSLINRNKSTTYAISGSCLVPYCNLTATSE